jgi:uncharacterized protein YggE
MSRLVLLIVSALALSTSAVAQTAEAPPVITTTGEARLSRAPDLAWVSVAAEARADRPGEAQRLAAEAMASAQAALEAAGLPADAIRTTGYSLRPNLQYQNGRSTILGYIANNQIEVRVDELDRLGAVLDAAGGSGATAISGLRFDLKDRTGAEREALRMAVEDALGKARAIASGAGASIGPVVRIDEQGVTPPPQRFMMRAEAAQQVQTPVTPGELEIVASVTLTVQIR